MGKGKSVKIGYRYKFGIHMGLNYGECDEIVAIKVGGKTAWTGSVTTNSSFYIDQPNLFGGDKGEGGIQGTVDVMMGGPTQPVNSRLASMLGGLVPAFRGFTGLFYDGLVTSMNPYPKPWTMRRRRALAGWDGEPWYPETARIVLTDPETGGAIHAMNPAHILYELETNRDWGRGKSRSRLDDAVWRAAADQLYAEGFGLCLRWIRTDSIAQFGQSVTNHIGANLYTSRSTGLRKVTLIRDDYDPETLPHFTPDTGLLLVEDDDNSAAADAVNEIIVVWKNPIDATERRARERNPAAIRANGGRVISATSNYIGVPTYELAARLALRDIKAKGYAKRWKLVLDRRARNIEPGAAFKFSAPSRGLSNVIVRAGRIVDDGKITITAVVDVFGLPAASFSHGVTPGYVPPSTTPQTITTRRLIEATWRDLVREIDGANLALIDDTTGFARAIAIKPTSLSLNYDIQTRVGVAAYETRAAGDFCPSALLVGAIAAEAGPTAISLAADLDLEEVVVGTAALIDEEWVRIDAIDLNALTATIARGCIDSVPAAHAAGARIWFTDNFGGADPTEYTASTNVDARLLSNTSSGQLDPGLAGTDALAITARQAKPYPPGNLRLNGVAYPADVTGEVTVTWSHRDRGLQADQLVDTTDGNIGPEATVTYRVRFYNGLTLERTYSGITGTSCTYLTADETADGGPFDPLRIVVDCERGGIYSHQVHDVTVGRV